VIKVERTFPVARSSVGRNPSTNEVNQSVAPGNILDFQQSGVTTILVPQGHETAHTQAAGQQDYRPPDPTSRRSRSTSGSTRSRPSPAPIR